MGELVTAAESGDVLATLTALRDTLANDIEACTSARDKASLAKQMLDVLKAIEAIPTKDESSKVDEVTRKRDERRAGLANGAS